MRTDTTRLTRLVVGLAAAVPLLLGGLVAPAPAQAAPIIDQFWKNGQARVNTKLVCNGFCLIYQLLFTQVNVRGPERDPAAVPRVGERFYVHAYAGVIWPFDVSDSYRMDVLLPAGLEMDVRSDTDVQCTITDASFNQTRSMGPGECLDPVRNGVYWRFPAVSLSRGEVANFFFPVVATRPFPAGDNAETIGVVVDPISNPQNALPDPLFPENDFQVDAGPPAPPRGVAATGGNARATVRWTPPATNGGRPITGYTATASPGGRTCNTTGATSCTITGLTNGTSYRMTVRARNAVGQSAPSAASGPVVPATTPGPVRSLRVASFPANGRVTIAWLAPATNGGAPVTGYRIRRTNGGTSPYGAWAPVAGTSRTLTGLIKGRTYRAQVAAVNRVGLSPVATVTWTQRR